MAERILIAFNKLAREDRESLTAATSGRGVAPIMQNRSGVGGTVAWAFFGAIAFSVAFMVLAEDFGSGWEPVADWSLVTVAVSAGIFVTAAALSMAFVALRKKRRPYASGQFLFPTCFVDTTGEEIEVLPIGMLDNIQATHHYTNGAYTNTVVAIRFGAAGTRNFSLSPKIYAEQQLKQIGAEHQRLMEAVEQNDVATIRALDPFFYAMTHGGLEARQTATPATARDGGPVAQALPPLLRRRLVASLAIGLAAGLLAFVARNLASDQIAFASAKADGDEDQLNTYARAGWLHVAEAQRLASDIGFKKCTDNMTEAACKSFVDTYAGDARLAQVKDDLLPRAALKDAGDDPAKLRDFLKRYPSSVVDKEARDKLHAAFAAAFAQFRLQANKQNPRLLPFVEALLADLEKAPDADVAVRFHLAASESLSQADKVLSTMKLEGELAQVTPHFTAEKMGRYEDETVASLERAFGTIFPPSLLHFTKGEALPVVAKEGTVDVPALLKEAPTRPELDVMYGVDWTGSTYYNEEKTRAFVGIGFGFGAFVRTPAAETPMAFELAVEPPEHFTVSYETMSRLGLHGGEPSDALVYQVMGLRAFDQFGEKLRGVFFAKNSEAFLKGAPMVVPTKPGSESESGSDD